MSPGPSEIPHAGTPDRTARHAHSERWRTREAVLWIAFALIVAGALLRFHGIDRHGLWADELFSAATVWFDRSPEAPWFEIKRLPETRLGDSLLTQLAADVHPPMFEIVLAPWMKLFGPSELSVRFPGFLASVLLLPILFLGVRRLSGPTAGLLALSSAALDPGLVFYAKDARHYSFLVLFSVLAALGALDYWGTGPGSRQRVGWRHVGPLLPLSMTHYFGTLLAAVLAGGYTFAALRRRDHGARSKLGALLGLNAVWFSLNAGGLRWGASGINRWTTYSWADIVTTLIPSGFELAFPAPVGLVYLGAVAALALPAVRRRLTPVRRAGPSDLTERCTGTPRAVAGLLAAYGSVLLFICAFSIRSGAFNPRFTLHVFALLHVVGAIALAALLGRHRILVPAFLALCAVSYAAWPRGPRPSPQEYREASRFISGSLRQDDVVVGANAFQDKYYYFYLSRMVPDERYEFRPADSDGDMRRLCEDLASGPASPTSAVWIFYPGQGDPLTDAFDEACGVLFRHDRRQLFRGVSVDRFVRLDAAASASDTLFSDDFEGGSTERWSTGPAGQGSG